MERLQEGIVQKFKEARRRFSREDDPTELFLVSQGAVIIDGIFTSDCARREEMTSDLNKFFQRNPQFVNAFVAAHEKFRRAVTIALIFDNAGQPVAGIGAWGRSHVVGFSIGEIGCSTAAAGKVKKTGVPHGSIASRYSIFHTDKRFWGLKNQAKQMNDRGQREIQKAVKQVGFSDEIIWRILAAGEYIFDYDDKTMSAINYLALVATEAITGEIVVPLTLPDLQEGSTGRRGDRSE